MRIGAFFSSSYRISLVRFNERGGFVIQSDSVLRLVRSCASRLKDADVPPRVLIVDDESDVRRFIDRVLRDAGYATCTAPGGAEALQMVAAGTAFDLVVTDVRMPTMSGPFFVQHLRSCEHDVKVLYLTAYSDQLFYEKTMMWADEAFLDKPCTVKGLLEAVSLLLFGHLAPHERPPAWSDWRQ
jgi:CheY-like chemotaxis protein